MTDDDRVIRALVARIECLERQLAELQQPPRTALLQGSFPRYSPDRAVRYTQPLVTVRS
jgi:hypothetical protein